MSRRARLLLGVVGLLMVAAAILLLAYALAPNPVESLRATLPPDLFVPPQGTP